MSKWGVRLGAVTLAAATGLGIGGASAFAAGASSSPTKSGAELNSLSGIKAAAAAAITLRVNDLNAEIAKVDAANYLGSAGPGLAHYLGGDIAPLQALGEKIAADTSVATAKAQYEDIFTDYRVIALVLPAGRLAMAADRISNGVVPRFTADSAKAARRVNGTTQATLVPLIANLNSEISAASTSTVGVATTVLGYAPSQWNADHQLLASARTKVAAAVTDINAGRSDLRRIHAYLAATRPVRDACVDFDHDIVRFQGSPASGKASMPPRCSARLSRPVG